MDIILEIPTVDDDHLEDLSIQEILKIFLDQNVKNERLERIIYQKILMKHVPNPSNLKEFIEPIESNLKLNSSCGKNIEKGDTTFRCLDCEKFEGHDSAISILCKECFNNSDHKDHKVIQYSSSGNGVCDCGDESGLDRKGFCKNHIGFSREMADKLLEIIPKDIGNRFINLYVDMIYEIFKSYEVNIKDIYHKDIINNVFYTILETLVNFFKAHDIFKLLMIQVLKSNFSKLQKLKHDCSNYTKLALNNEPKYCMCVIIENIFRFSCHYNDKVCKLLWDILLDLFVDFEFKKYLTITYTKMCQMIYNVQKIEKVINNNFNSNNYKKEIEYKLIINKFSELSCQLLAATDLAYLACDSIYCDNYFYAILKLVKKLHLKDNTGIYEKFHHITADLWYLCKQPTISKLLIKNTFCISILLDIMIALDDMPSPKFNDHDINHYLMKNDKNIIELYLIQARILEIYSSILGGLALHPQKISQNIIKTISRMYIQNFNVKYVKTKMLDYQTIDLNIIFVRSFAIFMAKSIDGIPKKDNILAFFIENFGDKELLQDFMKFLKRKTMNAFSYMYSCRLLIPEDPYILSNPFALVKKSAMDNIYIYYSHPIQKCQDCDLFLLQSLFSIDQDPNLFQELMEYSKIDYFKRSDERIKKLFKMSLVLCNDEKSIVNLMIEKALAIKDKNNELLNYCNDIYKRYLIQLLLMYYSVDIATIKYTINLFLTTKIKSEDILDVIADFDNKTKKLRLKEKYITFCYPYLFDINDEFSINYRNKLGEKFSKDLKYDPLLGFEINSEHRPVFRDDILRSLFTNSPMLSKFLDLFANNQKTFRNYIELNIHFAYLSTKIYYSLSNNNDNFTDDYDETDSVGFIQMKEFKNFQEHTLTDNLKAILNDESLSHYHISIKKIMNLKGSNKEDLSNNEEMKSSDKDNLENNKNKKKNEILKQFQEKQIKALKITENTDEISNNIKKQIEEEVQECPSCYEILDKNKPFGYSVYISLSNIRKYNYLEKKKNEENIYNSNNMDENELTELKKGYPVMSGCNHVLHLECHQNYRNFKVYDASFINTPNDFECFICKRLSNYIMILKNDPRKHILNPDKNLKDYSIILNESFFEKHILPTFDLKLQNKETEEEKTLITEEELADVKKNIESFQSIIKSLKSNQKEVDIGIDFVEQTILNNALDIDLDNYATNLEKFCQLYSSLYFIYKDYINKYRKALMLNYIQSIEDMLTLFKELFAKNAELTNKKDTNHFENLIFRYLLLIHALKPNYEEELTQIFGFFSMLYFLIIIVISYIKFYTKKESNFAKKSVSDIFNEVIYFLKQDKKLDNDFERELRVLIKIAIYRISTLAVLIGEYQFAVTIKENRELAWYMELDNYFKLNDTNNLYQSNQLLAKFYDLNQSIINNLLDHMTINILQYETINFPGSKAYFISYLPETIIGFRAYSFKLRCNLCMNFSVRGMRAVCLICGKFLCIYTCENKSFNDIKMGNLNCHAIEYHNGVCIFIDGVSTDVILINFPKNIYLEKTLYTDKYGQNLRENSINLEDFRLNKGIKDELLYLLNENKIPQEIYYHIAKKLGKKVDGIM